MNTKVVSKSKFITTKWAGGTTTELVIYPEGSAYKALDFDFRLSIATVNAEKSVFTSLPGVSRTLMVLNGALELAHEGHHSKKLKQFESDTFLGDWQTTSLGQATDFNLMTTGSTKGTLTYMQFAATDEVTLPVTDDNTFVICYVLSGMLEVRAQTPEVVEDGSLIWIKTSEHNSEIPLITALNNTDVVVVLINIPKRQTS